ncbi:DUF4232 domain-containing protein [Streptomyces laurentii]|uniref:DUF4232 domain-containing protein n=1 Tax=Streptomyces laurentii TaxID=39478 RepID=UPI0033EF0483
MRSLLAARPALAATTPLVSALAATALLLTGCGTTPAGAGNPAPGGATAGAPSAKPVDDPGKDGARITSITLSAPSVSPSPSSSPSSSSPSSSSSGYGVHADSLPSPWTGYGVRPDPLDAPEDPKTSAAYEVVNTTSTAQTYTVVVTFTSSDGGAMSTRTVTVRDVAPGKTARGTVHAEVLPPGAPAITGAHVLKATKVPADEAPIESGPCPASGVRVSADQGDATMGLRVVGLHLVNCGTRDYTVEGYPLLVLLDSDHEPVSGVRILDGGKDIATGVGGDEPPRRVTLRPNESATANLVWRNTTEAGTAVNVPHVRVRAKAGAAPVTVTPNLDLGTTGRLGVTPWKKN